MQGDSAARNLKSRICNRCHSNKRSFFKEGSFKIRVVNALKEGGSAVLRAPTDYPAVKQAL